MKRILAILLCIMLLTVSIAGCTQNQELAKGEVKNEGSQESATEETKGENAWPQKPIQLIVPVGAGGDTDTNARILAKYLEEELGQPVVISNMKGAAGSIGTRKVKDSKPDGYTALFFHNTTILAEMRGLLDFDVIEEFEVAGIPIKDQTGVMVANADKFESLEDLINQAKERPGEIKVAASTGSLAHLIPLAIEQEAGVDFNIVDAGGTAERIASLKGGHIDMFFGQYGVLKDYIETGDFVCLGTVSGTRSEMMKDIPTFKEQGIDIAFDKFFYYAFPPNTPKEIVEKFTKALEKVTQKEEVKKDLSKFLLETSYSSPEESKEYMKNIEEFYNKYKDVFVTE